MKPTVLLAGIVLIVMGIGGNYSMESFLKQCDDNLSKSGSMFRAYLVVMCDELKLMQFAIVITAIVGFGIMIYGAVAGGKPKKIDQEANQKKQTE